MGDEISNRPVRVSVVPGPLDFDRLERTNKPKELIPFGPLFLDLGVERVAL
jgi:hypothetical protein